MRPRLSLARVGRRGQYICAVRRPNQRRLNIIPSRDCVCKQPDRGKPAGLSEARFFLSAVSLCRSIKKKKTLNKKKEKPRAHVGQEREETRPHRCIPAIITWRNKNSVFRKRQGKPVFPTLRGVVRRGTKRVAVAARRLFRYTLSR